MSSCRRILPPDSELIRFESGKLLVKVKEKQIYKVHSKKTAKTTAKQVLSTCLLVFSSSSCYYPICAFRMLFCRNSNIEIAVALRSVQAFAAIARFGYCRDCNKRNRQNQSSSFNIILLTFTSCFLRWITSSFSRTKTHYFFEIKNHHCERN